MSVPKKPQLVTRHAFLDTSAYLDENYALQSTAFKSLMSLCRLGKASFKLTDITVRELHAKIEEGLAAANKALEEKTRNTKILRNVESGWYSNLFQPLDQEWLHRHLVHRLEKEFKEADAEIIPATPIASSVIFDRYFSKKPPFGPAKKKNEFPDAFVIAALEDWCARKKQNIYVISSDTDMESACSETGPLLHLKSVGEFVDLILREEDDEAEFLAQFFVDNPKPIIEAVTKKFEDRNVYLEDEYGDGEASVSEVELGTASVVSLEENEAVLELDATISFSAQVSYDAGGNSWDSRSADLDRTETVPVEVTIKFQRGNKLNYEVTEATVNNGESVRVYVDEDAKTHWK